MQSRYVNIDRDSISAFVGLYVRVFNAPPWNDGWTEETVKERFESFASYPTFFGLGLLADNTPTALAFGWRERVVTGWYFHLKELCVAPEMQRKGVGSELLAEVGRRVAPLGVTHILTETGQSVPARAFYDREGYKLVPVVSLAKRLEA
jgi:aminoglycoside 6'-N-acetyltransferase I